MGSPTTAHSLPLLHTAELSRATYFNRVFTVVYTCAILALLYRHAVSLLHSPSLLSLSLLISDVVLSFMWMTAQSFRYRPIHRRVCIDKLDEVMNGRGFPALDVFICTADPYKEPPMSVVNTALSLMAYDYPTDKVSVYVSDDGGSQLTLFALMEAAKFAREWLPFCREKGIQERAPEAYFSMSYPWCQRTQKVKMMYDNMKEKVENVVEKRKIIGKYITVERDWEAFKQWSKEFTRQDHPTVIQVLLECGKDKDVGGQVMPNLIYLARQKSITSPHHFKAGALNALLRLSAIMTNAPVILTQDCDMFSNDPLTPLRALCYLLDPYVRPTLGYVQFPQCFYGLNKNDIYAAEVRRLFQINPKGFDGLRGPNYVGTGCFFSRRALFGGPSSFVEPEVPQLSPHHSVDEPIQSPQHLELAQKVASCDYENQTLWGSKIGFRYGSLVEDFYTGYLLKCEGWKSIYCQPEKPAFLGDGPNNLVDALSQLKRWSIGLLEVSFSKHCPLTFGVQSMGLLMGLAYSHYAFWPIWCIPLTVYAFLPQLALLNRVSILPMVSDPGFFLYAFLFVGAYGQDFLDFILDGGTAQRWWSDQRMWMIRGLSSYLFGLLEFLVKNIGIATLGFNLTNKVVDEQQSKRYEQEMFEFRVKSPMFVPMTTAAVVNLFSFLAGIVQFFNDEDKEVMHLQVLLAGFIVVNCWPIYEAMVLRADKGKMPAKISIISTALALALCIIFRYH